MKKEKEYQKHKAIIKAHIISATKKFAEVNGYTNPVVDKMSDNAKAVVKALLNPHLGYVGSKSGLKAMGDLMSAVIGEELIIPDVALRALTWTRFAAVIPTNNPNSHSYVVGKPTVIVNDCVGIQQNGIRGNSLNNSSGSIAPATEKEIDEIPDEVYSTIIREYMIVA